MASRTGFHPELPRHALQAGADALVTSAHKTLPAYTQSALILARTERIDRDRIPCYVITHNPDNVAYYERFGFRVMQMRKQENGGFLACTMLRTVP